MGKLMAIVLLAALFFSNCKKNDNEDIKETTLELETFTHRVFNQDSSMINISDQELKTNWVESFYGTHKPISNQNIFYFSVSRTEAVKDAEVTTVGFTMYLAPIEPEKFFNAGIYPVDSINVEYVTKFGDGFLTKYENFQDAKALLKWESASFADKRFKGKGSLVLSRKLTFKNGPYIYFPPQTIGFTIK